MAVLGGGLDRARIGWDRPGWYPCEPIVPGDRDRAHAIAPFWPLVWVSPRCTLRPPSASRRRALTTDGPFAATEEGLGGYYLIEVDDLDEPHAFAARIPSARMGGAVEVRPIVDRGAVETRPGS